MTELLEAQLPKKDSKKSGTQVKFLYDKDVFAKGCGSSCIPDALLYILLLSSS